MARIHPFEKLEIHGSHCVEDCEYIHDFRDTNGKPLFTQICQIDEHSARAMVAAAVAGYEESTALTSPAVTSYPTDRQHVDVPNKGFVALWAEVQYSNGPAIHIFGLYRRDFSIWFVRVRADQLLGFATDRSYRFSDRLKKGLMNA